MKKIVVIITTIIFSITLSADITKTKDYKYMDKYCKSVGVPSIMKKLSKNINDMILNSADEGMMKIDPVTYLLSATYAKYKTDNLILIMRIDVNAFGKLINQNKKQTIKFLKTKEGYKIMQEDNTNMTCSIPQQRVLLENGAMIQHHYFTLDGEFLLKTKISKRDCK